LGQPDSPRGKKGKRNVLRGKRKGVRIVMRDGGYQLRIGSEAAKWIPQMFKGGKKAEGGGNVFTLLRTTYSSEGKHPR